MYYHLTRKTRSFIYTCNYWGWCRGRGQSECGVGPVPFYFWQKLRGEGVQTSCLLHLAFLAPVSFGFLLLTLFFETQWFCYLCIRHPASLIHKHPLPWDAKNDRSIWRFFGGIFMSCDFCGRCYIEFSLFCALNI